jgi:hypothetical protein
MNASVLGIGATSADYNGLSYRMQGTNPADLTDWTAWSSVTNGQMQLLKGTTHFEVSANVLYDNKVEDWESLIFVVAQNGNSRNLEGSWYVGSTVALSDPLGGSAPGDGGAPSASVTDNVAGVVTRSTTDVIYTYVFNNPVTGLDVADFAGTTNGSVSSVSPGAATSGTTWTVHVTPQLNVPSGNINLVMRQGAVVDASGNQNLAATDATQALNTTIRVAASGGDYTTIQAALSAASVGDTIEVAPGTYAENVTVAQGVTLRGVGGAASTFVDSVSISPLADGSTVTISGFTFNKDAGSQAIAYNGTYGDTAAVTLNIDHVSISNYNQNGISVHGGGANLTVNLSDATLTGNGDAPTSGGNGDVQFYKFLGDANLARVTVTGDGSTNTHGLSFTGHGDDSFSTTTTLVNHAMGHVTFDTVSVSGQYPKTMVFVQGYNDLGGLDLHGLSLAGGVGAAAGWTALYIDVPAGVVNPANFTAALDGTTNVSLNGVTIGSGTFGWVVPNFVNGGHSTDVLLGSSGADVLFGGTGADTITGGGGADTLQGDAGNDTFVFTTGSSPATTGQYDSITDLASGDKIDLPSAVTGILSQLNWGATEADLLAGILAAQGLAFGPDQVRLYTLTGDTNAYLLVDNGDGLFGTNDTLIKLVGGDANVAIIVPGLFV